MLITLLMLVAAFLGVDIPNAQAPTSGSCYAGASNGIDTEPGNFSEDWYAWEWCLYGGPWPVEGDFSRHGDLTTSQQVAKYVVNGIWQMYTPWMENALEASGPANASAKGKVTAPKVHVGQAAVDRHCNSPGWFGCGGGASVRWNGNRLTYQPGIIAVREINIFPLLHELAHAIDGHRWISDTTSRAARENKRTHGHGLNFKCLALDLYNLTGSVDETAYQTLNSICHRYAPDYAQPKE